MNAQTYNKLQQEVLAFISYQRSTPKEKINLEDSLFHDLGVDGDDALELINRYASKFGVSLTDFDINKYFGPESSSPIQMAVELFTKNSFKNTPRLTVNDLIQGAITGKLG